jgi:hypothetical protein
VLWRGDWSVLSVFLVLILFLFRPPDQIIPEKFRKPSHQRKAALAKTFPLCARPMVKNKRKLHWTD